MDALDMQRYDGDFYAEGSAHALRSARRIVPELLRLFPARRVVDVGCGVGSWLSVFLEHGVRDVTGIDGDHVDPHRLGIPPGSFVTRDLSRSVDVDGTFDLALSLEVAEHLPATAATGFVASLTELAPVVLFSAAVPSQGGVHHVNEQWPDHWAALFSGFGYSCVDCLRDRFWDDPEVSWWYAQNILLYVSEHALRGHPDLADQVTHSPRRLARAEMVERNLHRRRLDEALIELIGRVPAGSRALVADGAQLIARGQLLARDFSWLPFLERDGEFWGAPPDSETAIAELERMRREGADVFALSWTEFWWLDHYPEFAAHLGGYRRLHGSDRLILVDLHRSAEP